MCSAFPDSPPLLCRNVHIQRVAEVASCPAANTLFEVAQSFSFFSSLEFVWLSDFSRSTAAMSLAELPANQKNDLIVSLAALLCDDACELTFGSSTWAECGASRTCINCAPEHLPYTCKEQNFSRKYGTGRGSQNMDGMRKGKILFDHTGSRSVASREGRR